MKRRLRAVIPDRFFPVTRNPRSYTLATRVKLYYYGGVLMRRSTVYLGIIARRTAVEDFAGFKVFNINIFLRGDQSDVGLAGIQVENIHGSCGSDGNIIVGE